MNEFIALIDDTNCGFDPVPHTHTHMSYIKGK